MDYDCAERHQLIERLQLIHNFSQIKWQKQQKRSRRFKENFS